jgi:hypothetical protein
MADVIDQFEVDNQTKKVLKRIISSPVISTSCDPARVTTKGLRNMTFTSTLFPNASLLGKNSYEADQEKMKAFYRRNPTPTHASSNQNVDVNDKEVPQVPVHSTTAVPAANPPPEFFAQLIKTMKNIQVPQQPPKIVVELRDYEETINLAKLQNRMLQLFYVTGDINWDDGVVKNIKVATFLQGFQNLLARSTSVQATQLSNLFITIFQTKPEDDDEWNQMNPLNRLMSLVVFPPKFTQGGI